MLTFLFSIVVVAAAALLLKRAQTQSRIRKARDAAVPSIDRLSRVTLGGCLQWVQVRGRSEKNPVLILFHGGPALPLLPVGPGFQTDWEEHFTIVQWDQPGAGKNTALGFSLDRIVDNAIELADMMREQFPGCPVIGLGYSFGSIVTLNALAKSPRAFDACINVGQFSEERVMREVVYFPLLERMRALPRTAANNWLEKAGSPPWSDAAFERMRARFVPALARHGGYFRGRRDLYPYILPVFTSPDYSLRDTLRAVLGSFRSLAAFAKLPHERFPGPHALASLSVPLCIVHGEDDLVTPLAAVQKYFGVAPNDPRVHVLEKTAHGAFIEDPAAFLEILRAFSAELEAS